MARSCPSCRQTKADACSYPGEARQGCLRDQRRREDLNASLGPATIQYTRAKVKLRALFPDAARIEITAQRLEVEGLPLLALPALAHVLKVLTTVWGDDTDITPDLKGRAAAHRAGQAPEVRRREP